MTESRRAYTHVRSLARGGMGEVEIVVRAEGSFKRVYARKRLHAAFASEPEVRAMFVDEARIAGLVRHANVVSVLDVGEDEAGPFLVMDLVDGPPVSRLIQRAVEHGEQLPVEVALEIARQTALGLHAAHELRNADGVRLEVVHRDISPQNILVGFDGTVRVTDFGVARARDRITQTAEGAVKGKAGYMSPEQLRYQTLDRRTDLFSLGVVLWEMLAGERLYAGERVAAFRRILEEQAPRVRTRRPDVPEEVDALIASMLEKEPEARPATAREVATRLERSLRATPPDLAGFMESTFAGERSRMTAIVEEALRTSPGAAPSPRPRVRDRARARIALAVGALLLLGGAAALAYALSATREPPPAAATAAPPLPAPEPPRPREDVALPEEPEAPSTAEPEMAEPERRSRPRERRRRPATMRETTEVPAMATETPGLWWELPREGE